MKKQTLWKNLTLEHSFWKIEELGKASVVSKNLTELAKMPPMICWIN